MEDYVCGAGKSRLTTDFVVVTTHPTLVVSSFLLCGVAVIVVCFERARWDRGRHERVDAKRGKDPTAAPQRERE